MTTTSDPPVEKVQDTLNDFVSNPTQKNYSIAMNAVDGVRNLIDQTAETVGLARRPR